MSSLHVNITGKEHDLSRSFEQALLEVNSSLIRILLMREDE